MNDVYVVVKNTTHEETLYAPEMVAVFAALDDAKAFCESKLPLRAVWFESYSGGHSDCPIDAWYCCNGGGHRTRYRIFRREIRARFGWDEDEEAQA